MLTRQELSTRIGKRIRQIRMEKAISQVELGRLCGKDKQHIELIENNKVSANVYTLYIIAKALKIELKELLDIERVQEEE